MNIIDFMNSFHSECKNDATNLANSGTIFPKLHALLGI